MSVSPEPSNGEDHGEGAASGPPIGDVLSDAQLAELAEFGAERVVEIGDLLYRPASRTTSSSCSRARPRSCARPERRRRLVAVHGPGRFLGELSLLTGQRAYLTARVTKAGRVLHIAQPEFRRVMSSRPDLADQIFRTLVARRERLRSGEGALAVRIIGSRYSPDAMALRAFADDRTSRTRGSTSRTWTTPTSCSRTWVCARRHPRRVTTPACCGTPRPASSPSISASPSTRSPATSSTWSSWGRVRPASRPRCTARRRVSTPSRWTRSRSAVRRVRARGSRTTSASRTASRARSSRRGRPSRPSVSAPSSTRRARSVVCARSTASTSSCWATGARCRAGR